MSRALAVLGRYSKFIAALIGAITEAVNVGLLPDSVHNDVSIAVTLLTALGVMGVPNGPSAAHDELDNRVGSLEQERMSLGDLQQSFAAGTAAAVVAAAGAPIDQHRGQTGPPGKWPTDTVEQLVAQAAAAP